MPEAPTKNCVILHLNSNCSFFSDAVEKLRKGTMFRHVFLPVRPSVRIEQLHWTDFHEIWYLNIFRKYVRLRWSRGSVLAFGTPVRGFKPGLSRRIFKGEKILSTPSFGGEVKPSVPCRRFAACKRSVELYGSRILRRNLSEHFSPTKSSTFRC